MKDQRSISRNNLFKASVLIAFVVAFLGFTQLTMAYPKISNGVRLTDGRLVTTEGKGVYLLDDGRKRPISSPQVFKSHNFKFSNVQRIAKKDFEAIDNGDVLPLQSGTIAVSKADQKAYLIENGKKRYITGPDVVQKSLYSFEEAVMVKEEVLNQHPDGKDYTNHYYVANGMPIFAEETGVFLVKNNTKRPIPNRATYRSWFKWDELKEVSQEKMDELPTGDEIKPRDGTLLANDKTVYLVENGKKRAFSSVKEFRDGGFSFNNVMKVSNAVTSSLKEGKVMAEEIKNRVRGNQMSNLDVSGVSTPKRDFLGLTTVSKEKKNTIKYLNKSNGNSVWTYTHSNSNVDDVQYSPDGTLVYSRAASELVAHNRSSGTVQWKQNFNNNIKAMDGQEVSNAIYILTKANKIHKIDTKSGNIKWTREQSEFAGTSTDFDTVFSSKEVNRTFVSLKNKGGIYALNSKDGTLVWKKNWNKFDGASDIVLAPNGQDIYLLEAGSEDESVYKVDAQSGNVKWKNGYGPKLSSSKERSLTKVTMSPDSKYLFGFIDVSNLDTNVDVDTKFLSIDTDTGQIKWSFSDFQAQDIGFLRIPRLSYDKKQIILQDTTSEQIISLNLKDGSKKWTQSLSSLSFTTITPNVDEDSIYVSDTKKVNDNQLQYIFKQLDSTDGKITKTYTGSKVDSSKIIAGLVGGRISEDKLFWITAYTDTNGDSNTELKGLKKDGFESLWKNQDLKDVYVNRRPNRPQIN